MNILFLSLVPIRAINERGIYPDLLRVFVKNGHFVRVVSPEPGGRTENMLRDGYAILRVKTLQIQKANFIKKGIATLQIAPRVRRALEEYCKNERYDLVLMATPPVTLVDVVRYIKRRDGARFYLLLKDIWPQGIADLGVISPNGLIYRYYRAKEKSLYALADRIGCMSPANVRFLLEHNPRVDPARVEICPNSIEPANKICPPEARRERRAQYGVPEDKTVFLYGGNLGPVQCISFLIKCLRRCAGMADVFFLICGTGKDYPKLKAYVEAEKPGNVLLMNGLPKEDYEALAAACDVGLIFTDYRFTIPNFPSRLLTYMQWAMPVIACTDPCTDVGDVAEEGGFGWKCSSGDPETFARAVEAACRADRSAMGAAARKYLLAHYTAEQSYHIITGE